MYSTRIYRANECKKEILFEIHYIYTLFSTPVSLIATSVIKGGLIKNYTITITNYTKITKMKRNRQVAVGAMVNAQSESYKFSIGKMVGSFLTLFLHV